jgi:dTDP-4-amino-4,6-dideoxygalactose transaminase
VLLPVIEAGLRPVFADVGSDLNLSAESVKEAVSERTLAVILAHLGGRRALDADRIRDLTRNAGAWLIDDQCQSLGGARDGRQWGLDSDFSVFSFGPGKTLTATAGGLLVARERRDRVEALAKEMPIGDYGEALARFEWLWQRHMVNRSGLDDPQTGAPESAFRQSFDFARISPVDAALVLSQWDKMGAILSRQRGNAEALISLLDACQGMRVLGRSDENIWTKLTVQLDQAENRDGIIHWMRRSGIEPEPMYRPLHRREEAVGARRVPLARTEEVWRSVFNLPARPQLDPERMKMVAESLIRAMEKAKAGESHV